MRTAAEITTQVDRWAEKRQQRQTEEVTWMGIALGVVHDDEEIYQVVVGADGTDITAIFDYSSDIRSALLEAIEDKVRFSRIDDLIDHISLAAEPQKEES